MPRSPCRTPRSRRATRARWTPPSLTLALSLPSGFDIGLAYASGDGATASDGTALRPAISSEDYAAVGSSLTIPSGLPSADVNVRVVGDIVDELDEYFTLTVTDPVPELNRVEITVTYAYDDADRLLSELRLTAGGSFSVGYTWSDSGELLTRT